MQNAGQDSQLKSGNLDRAEAVYAFKLARINPENLSLKLWTFGGDVKSSRIACAKLGALLDEIDSAIANGDFCLSLDGAQFTLSEKLLREISAHLSSYHAVQGGSGAHVVRGGVSTPVKPKAPARAAAVPLPSKGQAPYGDCACNAPIPDVKQRPAVAARKNLINPKDTRAAKDVELCDTAHTARASANFEAQVARVVGDELRRAVMPILAEIDAIAALVKECLSELETASNDFITCAPGDFAGRDTPPAPRRKGGRESYRPKAGRGNAEGAISTRRGRTSVVVGRRKIS